MHRVWHSFDVSQEAFDLEKEVVLGEWARSANSARRLLYKKLYARMFAGHPYRYDILGHRDTIKTFTLEQATAFHKRYYVPNNACLVIVGDVKGTDILPVVVQNFAEIPKHYGFIPDDIDTLDVSSVPQGFPAIYNCSAFFCLGRLACSNGYAPGLLSFVFVR